MLRIELLGDRRLRHGATDAGPGIQYRKAWALLGYLALQPGRRHPREHLAELLWPGLPAASARTNLRQVLANLNRVLDASGAAGWLVVSRDEVGIAVRSGVVVDVHELEHASTETDPGRLLALQVAGPDRGGEFLAGLDFDDCPRFATWLQMERSRLATLSVRTLRRVLEAQRSAGLGRPALGTARRLAALDPLDEGAQRQWMVALAAEGRFDEAMAAYDRYASVLARELGGVPGPPLAAFRESVAAAARAGIATLIPASAPGAGPRRWICGVACRVSATGGEREGTLAELGVLAGARGALVLATVDDVAWAGVLADGPPGTFGEAASCAARLAIDLVAAFPGRVAAALCPGLVQLQGAGSATVLGNPGEGASHLLAQARPGLVLVCESLFPDLFECFALHPLADVALPGFERPIRVWRLGEEGEGDRDRSSTTGRTTWPAMPSGVPDPGGTELLTLRLGDAPPPPGDVAHEATWLTVVEGADGGKRVAVAEAPVVVGRAPDVDLQLPRRTVSRHHCVVWREAGQYRLRDLGATNRTHVNGAPVLDAQLAEGDLVSVGECVLRLGREG